MKKRLNQNFYSTIRYTQNDLFDRQRDPDGFLFADGRYKTKILPSDLPEWYVPVYIYHGHNFLSAQGVKYLVFKPNYFTNHRHKDDALYISYDSEIIINNDRQIFMYEGYDHVLFGNSIVRFVEACKKYAGYDTAAIEAEIAKKEKWFRECVQEDCW